MKKTIQDQKFGVEIELTGLTRERAAEVIAEYFDSSYSHLYDGYDSYGVRDSTGRIWKVMKDASIDCTDRNGNVANSEYAVEFVTPICVYEDIPTIQQLVRNLRHNGALANDSCGIHVHVNGAPYDARSLRNITNIRYDSVYPGIKYVSVCDDSGNLPMIFCIVRNGLFLLIIYCMIVSIKRKLSEKKNDVNSSIAI